MDRCSTNSGYSVGRPVAAARSETYGLHYSCPQEAPRQQWCALPGYRWPLLLAQCCPADLACTTVHRLRPREQVRRPGHQAECLKPHSTLQGFHTVWMLQLRDTNKRLERDLAKNLKLMELNDQSPRVPRGPAAAVLGQQ